MDQNKFREAENLLRQKVQLIEGEEKRIGRAIDKGGTYCDLGKCLAFQRRNPEAIRYLLMAYTEDASRTLPGDEDEARTGAAFNMLNIHFRVKFSIIAKANQLIYETKSFKAGDISSNIILKEIASQLNLREDEAAHWVNNPNIVLANKTYLGFPEPWEYRVFVGGAYSSMSAHSLYSIKEAIRKKDSFYLPIMGSDVYMREDDIHHHTLLLLHTCKWAIFDVSAPAGQLMEIERTLDYENEVLIVYNSTDSTSDCISFMVRTCKNPKVRFRGYRDLDDLTNIINKFLP